MQVLCIGGAADGTWIDWHFSRGPFMGWPIASDPCTSDVDSPIPYRSEIYKLTLWSTPGGEFHLFIVEGMTTWQAMMRLLDNYAPKS